MDDLLELKWLDSSIFVERATFKRICEGARHASRLDLIDVLVGEGLDQPTARKIVVLAFTFNENNGVLLVKAKRRRRSTLPVQGEAGDLQDD